MYSERAELQLSSDDVGPAPAWDGGLVVDDAFASEHALFVRRTLARLGVSPRELEDAVQETFLAALSSASRFEVGRSPRAWLYGIAVNIARDAWRRRRRAEPTFAEPPEIGVPPTQEQRLAWAEARSLIHRALDDLPLEQRDVLVLHRLEGWSMHEVADALGCPLPTAHSRLRLATARLGLSVRRQVLRRRLAAVVSAMTAALMWPPAAAAATVVVVLVATWGTVTLMRDRTEPPHASDPDVNVAVSHPATPPRRPTAPLDDLAANPASADPAPTDSADLPSTPTRATRGVAVPSAPRTLDAPVSVPPAPPTREASAPASGTHAEVDTTRSDQPTASPSSDQASILAETQLLARARNVVESSPATARALLETYDARFPRGNLRRERDAIAARLAGAGASAPARAP